MRTFILLLVMGLAATAQGATGGGSGAGAGVDAQQVTNTAYVLGNQFSIPTYAEVGINWQQTWDTNFPNSGTAMIRTQNTNYPVYVTTITPGAGTNWFVKGGRAYYDPTDLGAKYIGFTCSNTPTRIGAAWRVIGQNRAAAVNWIQLVIACSTNVIVTAPGNAGIVLANALHWTLTPDLGGPSALLVFTNSVQAPGIGQWFMGAAGANFAASPLGGRTTIGADTPDTGEIFVMEMMNTPAMGDTVQFRYRNETYTTNNPFVHFLWGKSVMFEVFPLNGSLPLSANYELIAMWAGTPPADLIGGQASTTLAQSNGELLNYGSASENLTLATGALTTDTAANLLPVNAIIDQVVTRVTTTITTAVSFSVGDATTAARFSASAGGMTAGSTRVGMDHWSGAVATLGAGPSQAAAAKVRITCNANPGAGAVRITVFYHTATAPTQ